MIYEVISVPYWVVNWNAYRNGGIYRLPSSDSITATCTKSERNARKWWCYHAKIIGILTNVWLNSYLIYWTVNFNIALTIHQNLKTHNSSLSSMGLLGPWMIFKSTKFTLTVHQFCGILPFPFPFKLYELISLKIISIMSMSWRTLTLAMEVIGVQRSMDRSYRCRRKLCVFAYV